jgi:hypothetical protein
MIGAERAVLSRPMRSRIADAARTLALAIAALIGLLCPAFTGYRGQPAGARG